MNNTEIEQAAYEEVLRYEQKNGRTARKADKTKGEGKGYDILSAGEKEDRHIEVKGTENRKPSFRFFGEREFKAMLKDPNFYLYLVCGIGKEPKIFEFRRNEILSRFKGIQVNYTIGFKRSDFE